MNILKTLICAALLVAGLSGCEKIDVNKLEGTWSEQYDPTVFAMDGSVTFTFDGNNGYQHCLLSSADVPGSCRRLASGVCRRMRR